MGGLGEGMESTEPFSNLKQKRGLGTKEGDITARHADSCWKHSPGARGAHAEGPRVELLTLLPAGAAAAGLILKTKLLRASGEVCQWRGKHPSLQCV